MFCGVLSVSALFANVYCILEGMGTVVGSNECLLNNENAPISVCLQINNEKTALHVKVKKNGALIQIHTSFQS